MLRTCLCDLLKIEYPILQGGMAHLATGELAAAVSEAGGLGIIGAGNAPAEWVRQEIRKVKERTDKPFGVNVMLLSPHVKEVMDVILQERVAVVTTGAGNPGPYIPVLKEKGIKVIPVVAAVALAKRLAKSGADALIAEGTESGGHIGETTTMALVPQVVSAVSVPVIAAGGFADGRGLLAALSLGAVGIQMGTRFVCASECIAHPRYKEAIIQAGDRDTVATGATTGHPVRAIRNKLSREFLEKERANASKEELEQLGVGRYAAAAIHGDVEYGTVLAGQIAGMVNKIEPAAAIIQDIMQGAEREFARLSRLFTPTNISKGAGKWV